MHYRKKMLLKRIGIGIPSLAILGLSSFYVVVLSGLFPGVQELWVTTAMTTLDHKWLATSFIDDDTVDAIMKRNYVDDTGYQTETSLVSVPVVNEMVDQEVEGQKPTAQSKEEVVLDMYVEAEGYTLLEEGIYTKEVKGATWAGNLMLIKDPSRVELTHTKYQFEKGQTVKQMVADQGARAGINGGGFVDGPNYDSNGGLPAGLLMKDGIVINPKEDNGAKHSVIGLNKEHILVLGKMTIKEALEAGIQDCVTFSPFLIVNGDPIIKEGNGGWGIAPRTALGQRANGEIIFLVIDGRQPTHSIGVDIRVLQDVLMSEGCINGAMVDGGSSTVMVYKDTFVNKPSLGKERWINNAWIVK
ncbi:MAG: phosphodiester glycosidase family protein [Cellulosilyticaceae bacterium]